MVTDYNTKLFPPQSQKNTRTTSKITEGIDGKAY